MFVLFNMCCLCFCDRIDRIARERVKANGVELVMCIHEIQPAGATYAATPWPWMQVGNPHWGSSFAFIMPGEKVDKVDKHSWKKVGSQDPKSFDFFGQN